jgi:hypothetical protein
MKPLRTKKMSTAVWPSQSTDAMSAGVPGNQSG